MGYVWSAVRWGRGALGLENQAPIEGKQTEEYAVVVDEADVHGVGEAERANKGEGASKYLCSLFWPFFCPWGRVADSSVKTLQVSGPSSRSLMRFISRLFL